LFLFSRVVNQTNIRKSLSGLVDVIILIHTMVEL
jgi:hypothetical protein